MSGLLICLRYAAKITHKAQSVTSLAAKWHTCATVDSFDDIDPIDETLSTNITSERQNYNFNPQSHSDSEEGDEDELDNTKLVPVYRHTVSFQKRQALGEFHYLIPMTKQNSLKLKLVDKKSGRIIKSDRNNSKLKFVLVINPLKNIYKTIYK